MRLCFFNFFLQTVYFFVRLSHLLPFAALTSFFNFVGQRRQEGCTEEGCLQGYCASGQEAHRGCQEELEVAAPTPL